MDTQNKRRVVLVSGTPGSGKTTLAVPLAAALGWPLLAKDHIKETLFDALGDPSVELTYSRKLGGAAMELMWALAARCPAVVLEANFRPRSTHERERLASLDVHIVEVHCTCPAEVASQRFAERAVSPLRHVVHLPTNLTSEILTACSGPMGMSEVIEVNTAAPVDIDDLVRRVNRLWPEE